MESEERAKKVRLRDGDRELRERVGNMNRRRVGCSKEVCETKEANGTSLLCGEIERWFMAL